MMFNIKSLILQKQGAKIAKYVFVCSMLDKKTLSCRIKTLFMLLLSGIYITFAYSITA